MARIYFASSANASSAIRAHKVKKQKLHPNRCSFPIFEEYRKIQFLCISTD